MNKEISFLSLKNDLQEEIEISRRKRGQNVCTCVGRGYVSNQRQQSAHFFSYSLFITTEWWLRVKSRQSNQKRKRLSPKYKMEKMKNEKERKEIRISSIWEGKTDSWFIGELIKKKSPIWLRFCPVQMLTSGLKTHAFQECESGGEKRGKTHTTHHILSHPSPPSSLSESIISSSRWYFCWIFLSHTRKCVYIFAHCECNFECCCVDFRNF